MLLEVLAQLDPRERWALLERRPQERKDQLEPLEIPARLEIRGRSVRRELSEQLASSVRRVLWESPDRQEA